MSACSAYAMYVLMGTKEATTLEVVTLQFGNAGFAIRQPLRGSPTNLQCNTGIRAHTHASAHQLHTHEHTSATLDEYIPESALATNRQPGRSSFCKGLVVSEQILVFFCVFVVEMIRQCRCQQA